MKSMTFDGRDFGALDHLTRTQYYADVPDKMIQFKKGEIINLLQFHK